MNATHDPSLQSWVESANNPASDFPIQNLPFGVFRSLPGGSAARIGVAIGDQILDLRACFEAGLVDNPACAEASLNSLMAQTPEQVSALRASVSRLLESGSPRRTEMLEPMAKAQMLLPAEIGDYTDFYASIHHATRVGKLFRPDNPLLPNYKWVPIGYHGRASSVVVSGTPVRRPNGQIPGEPAPTFGPSRALDYELEVAWFIGQGNPLGERIPVTEAERHIFGLCLLNDWSARDIQRWEYQPLGPFLGKSFATSISPWIVTREALEPFRCAAYQRPEGDPVPLPYLAKEDSGFDLILEVFFSSAKTAPVRLSRGNLRDLYWTPAQMVTHHASNGCNLRTGDLMASGTVSGESDESRGCLLEITGGDAQRYLKDGDEIIIRGFSEREGFRRIGFGECRGVIIHAQG